MADYLKAEIYKITHRRQYTFLSLGLILAGEMLLLSLVKWATGEADLTFFDAAGLLPPLLPMGLYLSMMLADLVFSDQYKLNTLKNEVSFGLPRARIYLGKLAASAMTAVAFSAILVSFYLLMCRIMFPMGEASADVGEFFSYLGQKLAIVFPCWLGALGFALMLLFVTKGSTIAAVIFVLTMTADQALTLLWLFLPQFRDALDAIRTILLTAPLDSQSIGYAWAVGLGWLLVSTAVGVIIFQKREIS